MKNKYFYKSNNFYHGIMFHHFHDGINYKKGEGSISGQQLINVINFIGKKNILSGDIFIKKIINKSIKKKEVCLTFDDASMDQINIALPILQKLKIKAIFFIHTSVFEKSNNNLELFRYFRLNYSGGKNKYFKDFFRLVKSKHKKITKNDLNNFLLLHKKTIQFTHKKFPFYSLIDIKFRLIRDKFLNLKDYQLINLQLMKKQKFNIKKANKILIMSKENLKTIRNEGHMIGLHSHNHPTLLEKLNYTNQLREYVKNIKTLKKLLPKIIIQSMAHPCGSYDWKTLAILKILKIKVGFKQIMIVEKEKKMKKINNSSLEIAREDVTNIINRMR